MVRYFALVTLMLVAACSGSTPTPTAQNTSQQASFTRFYAKLRAEAQAKGYNPKLLDASFSGKPAPIAAVTKSEKSQPELVRSFSDYVGGLLTAERIANGTQHYQNHADTLATITRQTGVPGNVVVALWGIETNFGKLQGTHPVIPALITLAWQSPRSDYFRSEVFEALKVLNKTGMPPADLKGSWAGAMGQCQFMPSSYMAYAIDGSGDGKADIWTNEDDVFASAANYLKGKGWRKNVPWRVELTAPITLAGITLNSRGLSEPFALQDWVARGFKPTPELQRIAGYEKFRYYKPQAGGPAFLLGPNFSAVLKWNNSSYFAYAVFALSDAIAAEANQ